MSFKETLYLWNFYFYIEFIMNFHYIFLKIPQHFPHYYTHEGGRAYVATRRAVENYLQEIYSRRHATRRGYIRGGWRGGTVVKPPRCPRCVSAWLRRGRLAATAIRSEWQRSCIGENIAVTSGGPAAPIQDTATCYTLFATRRNACVLPPRHAVLHSTRRDGSMGR